MTGTVTIIIADVFLNYKFFEFFNVLVKEEEV
ncbi:hypothetical protein SAMN05444387_4748 [Flavobacterium pectinovorum]|jgi:hypothetical protein|uniref:Uncharacterized protein n=1 Tax=Flavobacterium pectinovorum TaxID=29533 RepID=A0ABY1JA43_9FLAO|nr:hypothetical protein SAMN05444387_4748 [Flavobacterium pectinovorum]